MLSNVSPAPAQPNMLSIPPSASQPGKTSESSSALTTFFNERVESAKAMLDSKPDDALKIFLAIKSSNAYCTYLSELQLWNVTAVLFASCNLHETQLLADIVQALSFERVDTISHTITESQQYLAKKSREDNGKQVEGQSFAVHRQKLAEAFIKEQFIDSSESEIVALCQFLEYSKYKLTSGSDFGSFPDLDMTLNFQDRLVQFAKQLKYGNERGSIDICDYPSSKSEIPESGSNKPCSNPVARAAFDSKAKQLDRTFMDDEFAALASKKGLSLEVIEQLKGTMNKPISEMSTNELELASFCNSDQEVGHLIKSAHVLSLAIGYLNNGESKEQAILSGLDESDSIIRGYYARRGMHGEVSEQAAGNLLKKLTPAPASVEQFA